MSFFFSLSLFLSLFSHSTIDFFLFICLHVFITVVQSAMIRTAIIPQIREIPRVPIAKELGRGSYAQVRLLLYPLVLDLFTFRLRMISCSSSKLKFLETSETLMVSGHVGGCVVNTVSVQIYNIQKSFFLH